MVLLNAQSCLEAEVAQFESHLKVWYTTQCEKLRRYLCNTSGAMWKAQYIVQCAQCTVNSAQNEDGGVCYLPVLSIVKMILDHWWMNQYGALVEWYCMGQTKVLRQYPVPAPLYPPQISKGMAWAWEVRGERTATDCLNHGLASTSNSNLHQSLNKYAVRTAQ